MRKRRMLTFMLAIMMMFTLVACSSKELSVVLATNLVVEYGEELDNSKLFDAEKSDTGLTVEKVGNYDSKKIGKQDLKISFTNGDKKIEKDITVEVKDTKKPVIEVSEESITITVSEEPDYTTIIKKISDPVDGDLKQGKENEKGTYWIDASKLDINTVGEYEVIINAMDINGLTAEPVTIKVSVENIKKEIQENSSNMSTQENTITQNNAPTNNNDGYSTSSEVPQPTPVPTPQAPVTQQDQEQISAPQAESPVNVCPVPDESHVWSNNSGMVFSTESEAGTWAEGAVSERGGQWNGYAFTVFPKGCSNGSPQWGVHMRY